LVVADPERVGELVAALSELHHVEVLVSSGGDDTIELFEARRAAVVVLTASLQLGDTKSLIVTLRGMVPRAEVAIVVIGDDAGPIRTALDALELAPDRFVTRPLSPKALRFAVTGGIDAVRLVRGLGPLPPPPPRPVAMGTVPGRIEPGPAAMPVPPPIPPLRPLPSVLAMTRATPGAPAAQAPAAPQAPAAAVASMVSAARVAADAAATATRAALRARWEALADSIVDVTDDTELAEVGEPNEPGKAVKPGERAERAEPAAPAKPAADQAPLPPPVVITPRKRQTDGALDEVAPSTGEEPGTTGELAPVREPTLIIRDPGPARASDPVPAPAPAPMPASASAPRPAVGPASGRVSPPTVNGPAVVAARPSADELWFEPTSLVDPIDRDPKHEPGGQVARPGEVGAVLAPLGDFVPDRGTADRPPDRDDERERHEAAGAAPEERQPGPIATVAEPRDFARELRAKMSMMAQRLFQSGNAPAVSLADHAPRHDHHTEIDLGSLGDDQPLGGGGTEIEVRAAPRYEGREAATSPGSWDTQVRERGLPDSGTITRGGSDAAMLLAKMFAQGATGRVGFRRDDVETVVYFDHGRPVFASSNEPRDRMGELLLREGKITAAQYERCQAVVAESGRRMGEILVDLGYLKRRELLPAVRRHVEDLVYSLFGWERGTYYIALDPQPSAERIRLSRHPAALILEGIRRKLDRSSLERLIGPASTVIEVRDRERLGGIVHMGDLAVEERSALAAFDGQADLTQVARTAGVDVADVLPLAWGLCVLGLATARRTDTEVPDESTALVGETDLAIDRERVRARWQLVTDADYFALLGVRRDATGFEIRRAYQSARRDFAADCFPGDLRRELARELDDIAHVLDEAFRVLRDDRLRQTYLANLVDN